MAVDRPPGIEITTPALNLLGLGLGDPGLPRAAGEVLQDGAAVIALVGDQLDGTVDGRAAARRVQAPGCRLQGVAERGGAAAVRRLDLGRDDRLSVEVHGGLIAR
jgi:hypothetical protein